MSTTPPFPKQVAGPAGAPGADGDSFWTRDAGLGQVTPLTATDIVKAFRYRGGTAAEDATEGDFSTGLTGAASRMFYDQSGQNLVVRDSGGNPDIDLNAGGESVLVNALRTNASLNVGNVAAIFAVGNGDIVAGSGSSKWQWDASAGLLRMLDVAGVAAIDIDAANHELQVFDTTGAGTGIELLGSTQQIVIRDSAGVRTTELDDNGLTVVAGGVAPAPDAETSLFQFVQGTSTNSTAYRFRAVQSNIQTSADATPFDWDIVSMPTPAADAAWGIIYIITAKSTAAPKGSRSFHVRILAHRTSGGTFTFGISNTQNLTGTFAAPTLAVNNSGDTVRLNITPPAIADIHWTGAGYAAYAE